MGARGARILRKVAQLKLALPGKQFWRQAYVADLVAQAVASLLEGQQLSYETRVGLMRKHGTWFRMLDAETQ